MRKLMLISLIVLLAGCTRSEGEKAERQYNMVASNLPSPDELCSASREVAAAYLKDENDDEYQRWNLKADIDCNQAALDRLP